MEIHATMQAIVKNTELMEKLCKEIDKDLRIHYVDVRSINPNKTNKLIESWRFFEYGNSNYVVNGPEGHPYHYDESDNVIDWQKCIEKYSKLLGDKGAFMVWFSSCDYDYYNVVLSTTEAGYMVLIDSEWPGKYSNLKAAIRSEYSDPELVKAILSKL